MTTKTIDIPFNVLNAAPNGISLEQGASAMMWLHSLTESDGPDAAQARIVWGIIRTFGDMGAKGGRQRAVNLTPKRRSDIAKKAAKARWAK